MNEGPRPPHDPQARRGPLDGAVSAVNGESAVSEQFRGQVTLDGPSGTGKSSVARAVATRLGAAYLDTGAMYRAATVAVLDAGADLGDAEAVERAVARADIRIGTAADAEQVTVDGVDVAARIRGTEVTRTVSPVSAVPAVRRLLVDRQRRLVAEAAAVVVEGRDIGTVVLPDATCKVYLTAAPEARAQRRAGQLGVTDPARIAEIAADLRRRDEHDSSRADSPLRPAADAVVVDSTGLDQQAVVERVLDLARAAAGDLA